LNGIALYFVVRGCRLILSSSPVLVDEWFGRFVLHLIVHLFVVVCCFWLSLILTLLVKLGHPGFWSALTDTMSPAHSLLSIALIVVMVLDLCASFGVLNVHVKIIANIDREQGQL